jgi:hypothetical protein
MSTSHAEPAKRKHLTPEQEIVFENGPTACVEIMQKTAAGDEPASYCSALPVTLAGRRCVVAFLQNALAVFELRTGRLLWQKPLSHGYNEHAARGSCATPCWRPPSTRSSSGPPADICSGAGSARIQERRPLDRYESP